MSYLKHNTKRLDFGGKIAIIGQTGSGKTHLITRMINDLALETLFPWDEENELGGTSKITHYNMELSPHGRFILQATTNHSTLKEIQLSMKNKGNAFKGLLLISDAISWNYSQIGVYQADQLRHFAKRSNIPICLIVNKKDLATKFLKEGLLDKVLELFDKTLNDISSLSKIHYINRVDRTSNFIHIQTKNDQNISFLHLEQLFCSTLDLWNKSANIKGLTFVNIRILVRSLLLGLYEHFIKNGTNLTIDENLRNRLNYYRPTAFETGVNWNIISQDINDNGKIKEPVFNVQFLDKKILKAVFINDVIATEEKVINFCQQLSNLEELNKWNLASNCFTDSVSKNGRKLIYDTLILFIKQILKENPNQTNTEDDITLQDLGLDEF